MKYRTVYYKYYYPDAFLLGEHRHAAQVVRLLAMRDGCTVLDEQAFPGVDSYYFKLNKAIDNPPAFLEELLYFTEDDWNKYFAESGEV
jgi:hypothetical protein